MMRWLLFFSGSLFLMVGCAAHAAASAPPIKSEAPHAAAQGCLHPAGWRAYAVGTDETAESIAARFGLGVGDLLAANCLGNSAGVVAGRVVYVPVAQAGVSLQTILPLGVSAFAAEPPIAAPNSTIRLTWQGQGAIATVRIGTLFGGQFYEEYSALPASGFVEVSVPDDGRASLTYVILVGDGREGSAEISAQTTVRVLCQEAWFFDPAPSACPSAPIVTAFHEQRFERGAIVYLPALGLHYVLVAGQEAVTLPDVFVPGMPPQDAGMVVPPGFYPTQGAIHYIWRQESVRAALGEAVSAELTYMGMMQRSADLSGVQVYFSAASGHIYRTGTGLVWGVIIP